MNRNNGVWRSLIFAAFGMSTLWCQVAPAPGPTSGYTPAAMVAGAPDGVRILSPHETVNVFNGTLSFVVPLYNVGGRGSAGYSMVLPIGAKWNMLNQPNNSENIFAPVVAVYPQDTLWPMSVPYRYSPGRIFLRESVDPGQSTFTCSTGNGPGVGHTFLGATTLTKVTFVEADGTEHEFLDTMNSGAPLPTPDPIYNCNTDPIAGGPDRGRVFEAGDSSGATFIADNDIHDAITTVAQANLRPGPGVAGWLFFKDGTRYYAGSDGSINLIIDRFGNETTIGFDTSGNLNVIDPLGRKVIASYANLTATLPQTDTITYPGASGMSHTITVTYDYLANHLISGASLETLITLFPMSNASQTSTNNPPVVSSITLPDNSSYTFLYNAYAELAQATLPSGGVYQYDYPTSVPTNGCSGGACALSYSENDAVTGGTM
jgi:hypothetical protein